MQYRDEGDRAQGGKIVIKLGKEQIRNKWKRK